jgi:hypothetical protein
MDFSRGFKSDHKLALRYDEWLSNQAAASTYHDEPKIADAFRNGAGVGRGEHRDCLFCVVEKFFRPGSAANLVGTWIPASMASVTD